MVTEINNAGDKLVTKIKEVTVSSFLEEVAREMEAGTIDKMNLVHFLINLFPLLSYPIIMAPLYQQYFQLAKDDFNKIIQERRDLVYQMIFKQKMERPTMLKCKTKKAISHLKDKPLRVWIN